MADDGEARVTFDLLPDTDVSTATPSPTAVSPTDSTPFATAVTSNESTPLPTAVASTDSTPSVTAARSAAEPDREERSGCCRDFDSGSCCMKTREVVESSKFSFICGAVLSLTGIALIALTGQLPSGDYFLIGPFCIAIGAILFIRGCVTKMAKRQQLREQRDREARGVGLTREQRSRRNEELALSQDNLAIPPAYSEVVTEVPKSRVEHTPSHNHMVNAESQANFGSSRTISASNTRPQLTRQLSSVQSQTTFPSMVSIAVDTSDLPTHPEGVGTISPPSYFSVTNET